MPHQPVALTFRLLDAAGQLLQLLQVPRGWEEVSLARFVAAYAPELPAEADEADEPQEAPAEPTLVEVLLGCSAGALNNLSTTQAQQLSGHLRFVLDLDRVLRQAPAADSVPQVNSLSFGSLLLAQQHIQAHAGHAWPAYAPYVLAIYRTEATWGRFDEKRAHRCLKAMLEAPVTDNLAACKQVLDQLEALAEQFKPAPEDELEPTDAEYDAGSEEFSQRFAGLLPLDGAAGGLVTNYEAVLKQDAATVLAKLALEGARAAFHRRVHNYQEKAHSSTY